MIRIGITGQSGFIGTHLITTIGLQPESFELVTFKKRWFENPAKLKSFTRHCDCIVHLAAMNRNGDPKVIYDTNIELVENLIKAMEESGSTPHVIFSSSIQEVHNNQYGKSKRIGREKLNEWAIKNGGTVSGLIIPNVFGPFGDPYFNSVVATFSHQLSHEETPEIHNDSKIRLIYVGELVEKIIDLIDQGTSKKAEVIQVPHTSVCKVSELLAHLDRFKRDYFENGIFPSLTNLFEVNLFNTFRSYINHQKHFPVLYKRHNDDRGSFVETIRLKTGGQVSFSTTLPGITRGNHFHTRKIERFAVIKGKACIQMRRIGTSRKLSFDLSGDKPGYVDMPIWYTHNITNTGSDELYTLFWINEFYDPEDADTFYENV